MLNTSFNENYPVVWNAQEVLDCFLRTKLDALSIVNTIISSCQPPENAHHSHTRAFFPISPVLGGAVEKVHFLLGKAYRDAGHYMTVISRKSRTSQMTKSSIKSDICAFHHSTTPHRY